MRKNARGDLVEIVSFMRKYTINAVFFLAILFFLVSLALSARGEAFTHAFYDPIRTTASRNEVVIVGIDDASLEAFGAWPWSREVFASLSNVLRAAGARVVVYDILFLEPRIGDQLFKEELSKSERTTFFAAKVENGEYLSSYLVDSVSSSYVLPAIANVIPDRDGKVRRYSSPYISNTVTCTYSLAQSAFITYTHTSSEGCSQSDYFRYPEKITTYSLVDVVSGNLPKEALKDKVVFVGSVSLGLDDYFIGMHGGKVPGVYVHASMFTSMLNAVQDRPISKTLGVILISFFSCIGLACIHLLRTVIGQTVSIISICVGGVLLATTLFSLGWIVPFPWMMGSLFYGAGYMTLARFIRERRKNERIENIFSKYVHKDVLKKLMESGSEIKLGGEKKKITVLFSDIRGFTTLSEKVSPEKLTSILNDYFSAMTPHVLEERGTIDKFIGDAIMAFWNAPLPVSHHEVHAVRAAIRMHRALDAFNKEQGTSLAVGIGIHTGFAVVGNIGGKDRVNYTILGDTVNLASRLEGITKRYGVATIVTQEVLDMVHDSDILFRKLDVITVVGKATPTVLYEAREVSYTNHKTIEGYEEALSFYQAGAFDRAEPLFKKLASEGDAPSEKMLLRIPEARGKNEWDGVWRFDHK